MNTINNIITLSLLVGLLFFTLSFVLYKRKALLMLRALFSARYFQQLLREGKFTNERIYLYTTICYFFIFPSLILLFFHFLAPELLETFLQPLQFYGVVFLGFILIFLLSQAFLWYFTTLFNYQEQRYLYLSIKALYRFYNTLFIICFLPVVWYARVPELLYFAYIPSFLLIFFTFFIQFFKNINGISRIHFFIYFCSLEILPYLLLFKLLSTNF